MRLFSALPPLVLRELAGTSFMLPRLRIMRMNMSRIPIAALKMRMARVSWTQIPKLPIVDSIRSPHGYEAARSRVQ